MRLSALAPGLVALIVLVVLTIATACGTPPSDPGPSVHVTAAAWPQADALFHQEPRWLGADGAYSLPLGADRTLWLFGDTFVATSPANVRTQSRMVRNTVAVQTGRDPTTATAQFHWRGTMAAPTSFFPDEADRWFWPGHGIRVGDALVIFLSRVRATPGQGLGFVGDGWRALVIDNPDADPADWHLAFVTPPDAPAGLVPVTALPSRDRDDTIYVLAQREPGDHAGFLARYAATNLAAGRLGAAAWWDGRTFTTGATPAQVMANAGPECSLHFDAELGLYVHIRSDGFGRTNIVAAFAVRPEGPWSAPQVIYRPPENDRPDAFVYAAKAHPELADNGHLLVTYAVNTLGDFATLLNDTTIYFPRFVKATLFRSISE